MFYLYAIHKCEAFDDIPESKRERWWLVSKAEDKQTLLDWHKQYKYSGYSYKVLQASVALADFFYPQIEKNRRTSTGDFLRRNKLV